MVGTTFSSNAVASTRWLRKGSCWSTRLCSTIAMGRRGGRSELALAAGRDVVGDLDWQGTQQLSRSVRDDLVSVFVLPPSLVALEKRLRARAQDSAAVVAARMAKSAEEMSHWSEYDYVIVNRDIEHSVAQVQAIVAAERLRRERQLPRVDSGNVNIENSIAEVRAIVTAERLRREQQLGLEDFVNHLLAA